jgi:hypothetical protein
VRKTLLAIAAAAVLLPASAWAGGHLEFGHWVVTSDAREAQFYACVDNNRPEMDAETTYCANEHSDSAECRAKIYGYLDAAVNGANPCLAKLKNPEVSTK